MFLMFQWTDTRDKASITVIDAILYRQRTEYFFPSGFLRCLVLRRWFFSFCRSSPAGLWNPGASLISRTIFRRIPARRGYRRGCEAIGLRWVPHRHSSCPFHRGGFLGWVFLKGGHRIPCGFFCRLHSGLMIGRRHRVLRGVPGLLLPVWGVGFHRDM